MMEPVLSPSEAPAFQGDDEEITSQVSPLSAAMLSQITIRRCPSPSATTSTTTNGPEFFWAAEIPPPADATLTSSDNAGVLRSVPLCASSSPPSQSFDWAASNTTGCAPIVTPTQDPLFSTSKEDADENTPQQAGMTTDISTSTECIDTAKTVAATQEEPSSEYHIPGAENPEAATTIDTTEVSPSESSGRVTMGNAESNDQGGTAREANAGADDANVSVTSLLLQLPGDALHSIASFVSPADWRAMSCTSRASKAACGGVFARVRMHGFRCATEVVSAWSIGEKADAKELAALYLKAGVPIYPPCNGHACNTIFWRMKVEDQAADADAAGATSDTNMGGGNAPSNATIADRFYNERTANRERRRMQQMFGTPRGQPPPPGALNFHLNLNNLGLNFGDWNAPIPHPQSWNVEQEHATYLEEKAVFWKSVETSDYPQNTSNAPVGVASASRSGSRDSFTRSSAEKISIKCHAHLVREHLRQHPSVLNLVTGESNIPDHHVNAIAGLLDDPPEVGEQNMDASQNSLPSSVSLSVDFYIPTDVDAVDDWVLHQQSSNRFESAIQGSLSMPIHLDEAHLQPDEDREPLPPPPLSPVRRSRSGTAFNQRNASISQAASMPSPPTETTDAIAPMKNVTVKTYSSARGIPCSLQRKMDKHRQRIIRASTDAEFESLMYEFWDEVFPQSKRIAYHDGHTAVPRLDTLESFLTTPCPKHIGIVQCEIERIKVGKKNVKGRLFPTYEYNLFIRDRTSSTVVELQREDPQIQSTKQQRHVVLMTAKNRGRNYFANADEFVEDTTPNVSPRVLRRVTNVDHGVKPKRKRGVNNYCMYMATLDNNPWQTGSEKARHHIPEELGRLQSNLLGTEFQIFSPRKASQANSGREPRLAGDASTVSHNASASVERMDNEANGAHGRGKNVDRGRRGTWPLLKISSRPNRRAIAHDEQPLPPQSTDCDALCNSLFHLGREMENGVITYTANLLGNRPRVMDVCIPKPPSTEEEGCDDVEFLTCCEWERYCQRLLREGQWGGPLEGNNLMLTKFRQLQEQLNSRASEEDNNPANENNRRGDPSVVAADEEDFGLLALQNRPPWWNTELGAFVLNFGGRVSVASVKNFQLCDRQNHNYIMLQFGRIQGRHSFTMDFQYPLTAVQAFAIAISSLQSKISLG